MSRSTASQTMPTPGRWSLPVRRLGGLVVGAAYDVGGMTVLLLRVLRRLLPPRFDGVELVRHLYLMGVGSVGIVSATALFTGALMVLQAAPIVARFNADALVGWGAGFTTLRELGPLLIALMFNGRVGANNTAELGTMVVTSQVDALRALAIDPLAYLVVPRVLAIVTMIFVLTVIGDVVAMGGAAVAAWLLLGVRPVLFMESVTATLGPADLVHGLLKSLVFGLMIATTSCHFGLSVRGGAPGVGRAVNAAVVAAATGVFVADYLLTFILP